MDRLKTFSKEVLPISAIPLAAYGVSYLAENAFGGSLSLNQSTSQEYSHIDMFLYPEASQQHNFSSENLNIFERIGTISIGTYTSYFSFMIVMAILNIIIEAFSFGLKPILAKKNQEKNLNQDQRTVPEKLKKLGVALAEKTFYYTFSYCLFRVMIILGSILLVNFVLTPQTSSTFLSKRGENSMNNLAQSSIDSQLDFEDTELPNQRMLVSQKPRIADVLDSIDVAATGIALSSDSSYAYLVRESGSLDIIDISNINSPTLRSSLVLMESNIKTIAVSNDGKTLFIGNPHFIEFVNITDHLAPTLILRFQSEIETDAIVPWEAKRTITSTVDGKTLFVSYWGLLVLDITNIEKPTVIFSMNGPVISHVLSKDSKYLYLTDGAIYHDDSGKRVYKEENTFKIYNIENPKTPALLYQFTPKGGAHSVILSSDEQFVYVLNTYIADPEKIEKDEVSILQILDISSKEAPILTKTLDLGETNNGLYSLSSLYHDDDFLFITDHDDMRVLNLRNFELLNHIPDEIKSAFQVVPSFDTRFAFTITKTQFLVIQLYLDAKNAATFSTREYILSKLNLGKLVQDMSLTSDGKTLVVVVEKDDKYSFQIINVANSSAPAYVNSVDIGTNFDHVSLSPNGKLVYIFDSQNIRIYDISNQKDPKQVSTIAKEPTSYMKLSSDLKHMFTVESSGGGNEFKTFDISDPSTPKQLGSIAIPRESFFTIGAISKDQKTAFVLSNTLLVIDITNLQELKIISTLIIRRQDIGFNIPSMALSKDGKTLFVTATEEKYHSLKIINLSNLEKPTLCSSVNLPNKQNGDVFQLSSDDRTIYLEGEEGGFLVINVMNPYAPVVLPLISSGSFPHASLSRITRDNQAIIIAEPEGIKIISTRPKYTVFSTDESFKLGGRFTNTLSLLRLYRGGKYLPIEQNYKFTKIAIYEAKILPSQFAPTISIRTIPTWMSFDKENALLILEPKIQAHIGAYNLFSVVSTFIPEDSFKGLPDITSDEKSYDLFITLIQLGYIDNEGFLTSSFDPSQKLKLTPEYLKIEEDIRKNLEKHYIETITRIEVKSSLVISLGDVISIDTLSTHSVNVAIRLKHDPTQEPEIQFVEKSYSSLLPAISDQKTRIVMEGPLEDVNHVLKELLINQKEETQTCDGLITISDGLNPSRILNITDITKYLTKNQKPKMDPNRDVQTQINGYAFFTGEPFTIELSKGTFTCENNVDLYYRLAPVDEKALLPNWISMKDLKIMGTPPNEWSKTKYDFKIIVENEFKEMEVSFILAVRISMSYALKLMASYGGYLVTMIGLWVYANKIYNIFAKDSYRHPKRFIIKVDEEINDKTIFPVAFIGVELKESALVFKEVERIVSREIKAKSSTLLSSSQLVDYFLDQSNHQLDKAKISKLVDQIIPELFSNNSNNNNQESKKYIMEVNSHKSLIQQIIINKIVKRQLELSNEKETRRIFLEVKNDWVDLVEGDTSHFAVNEAKLIKKLKQIGVDIDGDEPQSSSEQQSIDDLIEYQREHSFTIDRFDNIHFKEDREGLIDGEAVNTTRSNRSVSPIKPKPLEKPLLGNKRINIDLLGNAINAHAFEYQHIDIEAIDIHVEAKQKTRGSSIIHQLKRFLKLDLRPIAFMDKGKIGFGILYQIQNDILHFYGVPHTNVKGKTIVVQITNGKGKILRELWLYGFNSNDGNLREGETL